jgi:hypothetical protein
MRASYIFIILVMGLLDIPGLTAVSIVFFAIQCYSFISVVRFSRSQLLQ